MKQTVKSVYSLVSLVRMVPVRSSRFGDEAICELLKRFDRTLSDVRCSVHVVVAAMVQTVPVHRDSFHEQLVPHFNDHLAIPQLGNRFAGDYDSLLDHERSHIVTHLVLFFVFLYGR